MIIKNKTTIMILASLFAITLFLIFFSSQDSRKNEIRILIDRAPNTLDLSQNPDRIARKIIPLLTELQYQKEASEDLEEFELSPHDLSKPKLHFKVVSDDLTRSLLFLKNKADVLYDTLSLTKTSWMRNQGYRVLEAPGYSFSFLGFQLQDPILKNLKVRQAIALALPIQEWVQAKFFNWVTLSKDAPSSPNLEMAKRLLDEAGYPIKSDATRFTLRYLTTPVREGNEMAFLNREALKKVGISVQITPLETSLFFNKMRKGEFQLFSSLILRNTLQDPVFDYIGQKGIRNYFKYENPELESQFLKNKNLSWEQCKDLVLKDLPFVPLYEWKHGLVASSRLILPDAIEKNLDESFRFLAEIQLK